MILKKVLIAALIALLALSAGAALASRHHHGVGHRARRGHCYSVEGAGGYCHYDGACAHGGDACHFYADEDGDGVCDRCGMHWTRENGEFCGHHGCCR